MQDVELGTFAGLRVLDGTVSDPEPRRDPPIKSKPPKDKRIKHKSDRKVDNQASRKWRSRLYFAEAPGFIEYVKIEWPDLLTLALFLIIPLLIFRFASAVDHKVLPP